MKKLFLSLVLLAAVLALPAPTLASYYPACADVCCSGNPGQQCSADFGPRVITCAEYESVVPCF